MGKAARNAHHLFLVDDDPIGILQNPFKSRNFIGDGHLPVSPLDKLLHHSAVERTWPVEGHQGDDIFEAFRFEFGQEIPHPGTLQLENAEIGAGCK